MYATGADGTLITPVVMPVDHVLLVDQDTWAPGGLSWRHDTARTIRLGPPQSQPGLLGRRP